MNRPITILYVDDDPDYRIQLEDVWEENRLTNELHCLEDVKELMRYLRRSGRYAELSDAPLPGMILMELNMPDGCDALQDIKADPHQRAITTMVLTTSQARKEDILRAYDLGVDSFIAKPVTIHSLVNLVLASGKYRLEIVSHPPQESAV
jgi:CheY-like chemotaxis protein